MSQIKNQPNSPVVVQEFQAETLTVSQVIDIALTMLKNLAIGKVEINDCSISLTEDCFISYFFPISEKVFTVKFDSEKILDALIENSYIEDHREGEVMVNEVWGDYEEYLNSGHINKDELAKDILSMFAREVEPRSLTEGLPLLCKIGLLENLKLGGE